MFGEDYRESAARRALNEAMACQDVLTPAPTRPTAMKWNGVLAQVGVQTPSVASLVARLRQTIGAALIRAGERLAGTPRHGVALRSGGDGRMAA